MSASSSDSAEVDRRSRGTFTYRRECAPLDSDLQVNRQSSSAMRLAARNRPTDRECPLGAPGLQEEECISGEEYLSQLTTDHVIHTWDLARGIKAEERLAPDLIDFALEYLGPRVEDWRAAGAFGSKVEVDAGADRQTALLA